jgi:hypothetical protein
MLAAAAGMALLAVACGGGGSSRSSSAASGSSKYQKALAYSQCMRTHGMTNFPDPNSSGGFTSTGSNGGGNGGGNAAAKPTALTACRHLLPGGGTVTPAQQQQAFNQALRFSQCMRSHGLRDFPDPSARGARQNIPSDINPQSAVFQSAQRACQSLAPSGPGQAGGTP